MRKFKTFNEFITELNQNSVLESVNEDEELNEAAGMGTVVALAIALGLGIRLSFMPESKLQQILSATKSLGRSAWQSIKDFGYSVKRELPIIGPKIKKREADDLAYKQNKERIVKVKADIESYIANTMSDEDIIEIFKSNREFKYILANVAKGKRVNNTDFYNAVKKMLSGKSTKGSTPEPIKKLMKKIKADLTMLESVEFVNESVNEAGDFKPHMMYDPETGEEYKAEKPEDHERMAKLGYVHEKPEKVDEGKKILKDKDGNKDTGNKILDQYLKGMRAGTIQVAWNMLSVRNGVLDVNNDATYTIGYDKFTDKWIISGDGIKAQETAGKNIKNQEELYKFITSGVNGISFSK